MAAVGSRREPVGRGGESARRGLGTVRVVVARGGGHARGASVV